MKDFLRFWLISGVLALALAMTACGGGGGGAATDDGGDAATEEEAAEGGDGEAAEGDGEAAEGDGEAAEGGDGEAAEGGEAATDLTIANQGEQLLFNKDALGPVPAGEEVSLTLANDSVVNPHNWILLNTSDEAEAEAFALEAETYPAEENHMPPDAELVIANTGLLAAGANGEETINFTLSDSGEYIYVCTVPGHYAAGMHGVLTVE
jgi:azurin